MDPEKIKRFFLVALGLTYIGLGIFMFVKNIIPYSPWGEILYILFVVYGAWRVYRALKKT